MRVVTNAALIQRNRKNAQIAFFASLGVVGLSFFLSNWLGNTYPDSYFFFNCVIIPLLFGVILYSVRLSNNWVREPVPWKAIEESIKGVSSDAVLYHFILPARHVLISPYGVFVFHPVFQDRPLVVNDDHWRLAGTGMTHLMAFMRQEQIGNPTREAQREANLLQALLDKMFEGNTIQVQPVIVMTHPRAKVEISGTQSIPITYADSKLEPYLKDYIKSQKAESVLSAEQIESLDEEFIYAD